MFGLEVDGDHLAHAHSTRRLHVAGGQHRSPDSDVVSGQVVAFGVDVVEVRNVVSL